VLISGAGANGGVGHALALGFGRAGARLALCDIDNPGLQQTLQQLKALDVEALGWQTDIADSQQVERLFQQLDVHLGGIDVLINVPFAFPSRVKPHLLKDADWQQTLDVSLSGYFYCNQQALKRMLEQPMGGSIIQIGSNAGVNALGRGALPYSCAKAAVHQMTREIAIEYGSQRIRCNALAPAQIRTPGLEAHLANPEFRDQVLPRILNGLPQGRLIDPDELVGPALFLASAAASAINGVILPVDQGNTAMNAGGGS
jgi:NAD(P)-dependent dehydrogenase (short-subunit alcohol dehydrogenase family)